MVDFQTLTRTMRLADSEDRALLGSNPSAAVGDGDIDRSSWKTAAPVPNFFPDVLVRKAINPSFVTTQLWRKLNSLTRPVCHLAISTELTTRLLLPFSQFSRQSNHQLGFFFGTGVGIACG